MDQERPEPGGPRRPPAGPAPTEASLREAALAHLARYATSEAGLRRVLQRRVDRWASRAAAAGEDAGAAPAARVLAARVARDLAATGLVDDAAFAAGRARRLVRAGRSRRAIAADLAGRGVAPEAAAAALPEDAGAELDAALARCRRRRIGPFAAAPMPPEARLRALGMLARAGFGRAVAEAALALAPEAAADRLARRRQG